MRDDICTIPISEIFEENDGCPICRMYEKKEKKGKKQMCEIEKNITFTSRGKRKKRWSNNDHRTQDKEST